jgi:hypothetical protein
MFLQTEVEVYNFSVYISYMVAVSKEISCGFDIMNLILIKGSTMFLLLPWLADGAWTSTSCSVWFEE